MRHSVLHSLLPLALALVAPAVPAAPGDVLHQQTFETGGSCTLGGWTLDGGNPARAGADTATADTAPCSMYTQRDDVIVTSPAFDAAVPAADLDVWVRRGADSFSEYPDGGDDLSLQYVDSTGSWNTLEDFGGGGTAGEVFDRTYTLPDDALHGALQVRVVATGADGAGFDYWHVDSVTVTERQGPFVGTGTGLTGAYCNRDSSNETVPCDSSPDVTRVDSTVAFTSGDAGWPASGIDADTFSVRWTGQVQAQWTEDYTFHALHDDGVRVWVDGTLVIDNYQDQDDSWTDSGTPVSLQRGQRYDIVIEYYENFGDQDMTLAWSSASTPLRTTVPQSQLYPQGAVGATLLAEWRMDEDAWDGTAGEVTDSSGFGRDGTAQGGATTAGAGPAVAGSPGTCRYGRFDGSDDYVEVSNLSDTLNGTATLAFWIRTTQTGNDTGWQAPGIAGVEESGGTDDVFWGWIDASGHIGISVANDYAEDQKSDTVINDGSWHHVALTRDASSGETRVFVDGSLDQTGTTGTGTIGNAFSSIGRIEDTGGSPEHFDGDLDEVRVYDGVLDEADVQTIMNDTHPCGFCTGNAAFSDSFEDGNLGPWQVQGGGNDAGVSGDTADDGTRSAFLRGNGARLRSPAIDLSTAASASVAAWIRRGDDAFSEDPDPGEDLRFEYLDSGNNWVTLDTYAGGGTPGETFAPSFSLPAAALHAGFRLRLVHEGGNNGDFDYWHIDSVCLTTTGAGVDHYAIATGAGVASTCQPRTVTITAEDASNNAVTGYTGTVDLATSSGHGTWSVNAADGSLSDTTGDDGIATYTFVGSDNGTIDLDLSSQHADDLTITVTEDDGSPSSTSATLSFRDNAFVIDSIDALGDDVIAGRDHDLRVSLWRRDPSTGDCAIADAYDAAGQGVKLWLDRHADDPGGAAPSATGATSTTLPNSTPGSNNITLDFSAATLGQAGRAPLTLATTDVGRYTIEILDDTSAFARDTAGNPRPITGATNGDLVARPFGLRVSVAGNPAAQDATGTAYRAGGADFDVTVTGVRYQAADDDGGDGGTAGDGVPDGHADADPAARADLSDNAATASFGNEGAPEDVAVVATLWKPAGQDNPGLAGGSPLGFSGFAAGAATRTTSWNEVGIIELEASLSDGDYLGGGRDLAGRSGAVGRFHPDRLRVSTANEPAFADAVSAAFTYMGQTFGFDAAAGARPRVRVEALSADGSTVLDNYGGEGSGPDADFWLLAGTPSRNYTDATSGISAAFGANTGSGTVTWDIGAGDTRADHDGTATFEVQDDAFAYDRVDAQPANRQPPFDAAVDLAIPGADLDDGDACHDPDADATCDPFRVDGDTATAGADPIGGTELRYGRLVADAAAGAELAPIDMPVRVEYWTAGGWAVNAGDGATELTIAPEIDLTDELGTNASVTTVAGDQDIDLADAPNGGSTSIDDTDGIVTMGDAGPGRAVLTFAAPGADNTGWAAAIPRLAAEHPYLRYDWTTDGNQDRALDDDPRARVTFGIYDGSAHWIHMRRVPSN